jgi:hypothetical protein
MRCAAGDIMLEIPEINLRVCRGPIQWQKTFIAFPKRELFFRNIPLDRCAAAGKSVFTFQPMANPGGCMPCFRGFSSLTPAACLLSQGMLPMQGGFPVSS